MWALRRRVETIGIVVAALVAFVIFPYWITHREVPTCFDGKENQGEAGIDCGGPCATLCKGAAQDLHILWTKVFPIRSGEYDLVAYVENPNYDVGAPKFDYTAKLFDANGAVLATKEGEGYALPNERFVVFAGGMLTGGVEAVKGEIDIAPGIRWITTGKAPNLFSVSDKDLESPDKTPRLTAVLHNETSDLYRNIDVSAIVYDANDNPIGVSATDVEKLDPNGTANLIFTWPNPFNYVAETEACESPVDVVLALDRSGSMVDEHKLDQAKQAAEEFVDRLSPNDQGAYVTFASDASNPIDQALGNQFDRLKRSIAATAIGTNGIQFTNIGDALRRSIDEFATRRHNISAKPIIVLLTDGIPNRPLDQNGKGSEEYASDYARTVAGEAKRDGIAIYTIGLGSDVNDKLLEDIASTPEQYYPAASGSELSTIYKEIATAMCKRSPPFTIIPRIDWMLGPTAQ